MEEESMRPQNLMRECAKLRAEDVRDLLTCRDEFVEIPCPACEANIYRKTFKKDGFTFVTCEQCDTLFINPRPTLEMLMEFYSTSRVTRFWKEKIFPVTEESRRNQIFSPRAKMVIELCKEHKSVPDVLFDIGAGYGTFCEEIKKLAVFDSVLAIEPSHYLAEACRSKGLDVIEQPIEKVKLGKASVITNFELIEHLFWPKDFLLACRKVLNDNGLFILTTPNIRGFDLFVLGELSDNIRGPAHLNYFTPKSISLLFERCGFKVVKLMTPGKLDAQIVRKKILDGVLDVSKYSFLKHVLIDRWEDMGVLFQRFLVESNFSSHLWIVARGA